MISVDVLIIYETRVRELESVCLLKYELEKRGLTVAVINTWNEIYGKEKHKYKAKVVVAPSMYHDGIYEFLKSFCFNVPKVVNLQWEQIGSVQDKNSRDTRYVLSGVATQCMNICWGENTVQRLSEKSQIDKLHIRKTGSMNLDWCRSEFWGYYDDKKTILEKYHITPNKEINLFISSFSYVNLPEKLIEKPESEKMRNFISFSMASFDGIINWIKRLMEDKKDQVFIYRPHPAEANNPILHNLQTDYDGQFYVIKDFTVRQWIFICDRIYTWYSTSVAEVYAFGRPFSILRPVPITNDMEVELLENCEKIDKYEDFLSTFDSVINTGINDSVIQQYYYISEVPAYKQVAEAVIDVMNNGLYKIHYKKKATIKARVAALKQFVYNTISTLAVKIPVSSFQKRFQKAEISNDVYTEQMLSANYASSQEIEDIQHKISELLSQNAFMKES